MYRVYMHTAPNGKVYVGITRQNPERRWQNGYGYSKNALFSRAIRKYGWDRFKHEVIAEGLSKKEAEEMERKLIAEHKSDDSRHGYNITSGGPNAWWFGKKLSDEHRTKSTARLKGETNPHARRVICLETMEVYGTIAQAQEATGAAKICDCCKRRHKHRTSGGFHWAYYDDSMPDAHYSEMLSSMLAEETKPRTMSKENKAKLVARCRKAIVCVETGEVFKSLHDAATASGASVANLCNCCKGNRKTAAGLHWEYAEIGGSDNG